MSNALARAISILGHPLLVLPLAACVLVLARGERMQAIWIGLGFALFAALVMAYSWWQVRRGRWWHVDASQHDERSSLNRFLLIALGLAAILAAWHGRPAGLALALACCAAMIAVAMLTARWCKLSLHMAFAVFATALLFRAGPALAVAGLLLLPALGWSRLALKRHTPVDLLAGVTAGALAGVAFWQLSPRWGG